MARGLFEAVTAGHTILTPNAELAGALFDAVERTHIEAGRDLWPTPRIRDFGGWSREQYAERQFTDAAVARCLTDIEEGELWRSVILESEISREFLEPDGAAQAARRARRTLFEYGIALEALADHATEETLAFVAWNRRFEERCRELSCTSADQLLGCLDSRRQGIAWIESPVWRPLARRWLETHATVMLSPIPLKGGAVSRFQAQSPDAELAAIAEWAREGLNSNPGFRAWVCVPDLNLRRANLLDAFDATLAPQRFSLSEPQGLAPYAVAGGTPLADFAPVKAALSVLFAACGSVSFETFSALLRMPELQAQPGEAGRAAALDLELRSRGPCEADLGEWLRLSEQLACAQSMGAIGALQRLQGVLRVLAELRGNHAVSRWVPIWIEAFETGPWSQRHRWSSGEFQSAERLRGLLAELASADLLFGSQSLASAGRILRRTARDTAFQAQTGIAPIWISGQLHDPWLSYEGLWVAGCNEERWPPPIDPIALLPVRLQRDHGVVAAGVQSQLQFAVDLQRRWQSRAAVGVFSHAATEGGGGRASPLLPPVPLAGLRVPGVRPLWRVQMDQAPVLESSSDEQAPRFEDGERTRGVATLRAQSRCAFRGFAQTRLGTAALEQPVPGFNERQRGELLHDALQQIWADLRTSARLSSIGADLLQELVRECVARAIAALCRHRDPGPRWRQREQARLAGLLIQWLEVERLREPFEVEQLEQGTETARHGGLEFRVRIDRIDRLLDGARVLIDYKSGMATADWRGDRPDNPQLPIYALLRPEALVAVAYGRVSIGDSGFVAESERPKIFKPRSQKSRMEGMASFSELIGEWSRRIEKIAAEFAAGDAQVAPTLRACSSCHLQPLCRIPAPLDAGEDGDD